MLVPSSVRTRLFSVLTDIENNVDSFVKNPGVDMTRHRLCPFSDTILQTLCFTMNRTNTEILNYFSGRKRVPSKSALTQQRKKLDPSLFPFILRKFNESVPFTKDYKGYRLIAADGSDLNLPTDKEDSVYRVMQARSSDCYYQMHINALFDICENRYVCINTQPRPSMDEREALCQMISSASVGDKAIFIADRGYLSLNMLAFLIENRKMFLIRAISPASTSSLLTNLVDPETESDKFVRISVTRSHKKKYTNDKLCKVIGSHRTFDYIDCSDKNTVYYMDLRISCIKLDDGSFEYLVSDLPMDEFPTDELKDLYWRRWKIESSFRSLKYALSLVYLHSVNRELIIQELYAKVIMYNFTSLIQAYAQTIQNALDKKKAKNDRKYRYMVAFDNAVAIARNLIINKIRNKTALELLLRHKSAIKIGKSCPRHVRSQTVNPLNCRA